MDIVFTLIAILLVAPVGALVFDRAYFGNFITKIEVGNPKELP